MLATVLDELDCANDVFLTHAKMMLGGQLHYFSCVYCVFPVALMEGSTVQTHSTQRP